MRGQFAKDLTGQRFGNLTVVGKAPTRGRASYWYCQCDCGSPVKEVKGDHLKGGKIISCGCVGRKHFHDSLITHNQSKTRLYGVWLNMRNRCRNEKVRSYKDYGARGIKVCEEWENDFAAFSEWAYASGYDPNAKYGDCTIDRIDVDGPYCPENCRFVDLKVQANNRRRNKEASLHGQVRTEHPTGG